MAPAPQDLPRREVQDAASFLIVARALLEIGAYVWRKQHQVGHSVSEMEAVNFLRFATPRMVTPDRKWPGRWRVQGTSFSGRRIGLSCSIWMRPEGEVVYIVSAFTPDDP